MNSLDENESQNKIEQTNKIQLLIIGRLLTLFLLLVTTWVWNSGQLKFSFDEFPRSLFLVFLVFVALTFIYFFVLRFNRNFDWQVRTQFIVDALLITWLVWKTGDLSSPYIPLYIILIAISSLFLNGLETILLSVFSAILTVSLALSVAYDFINSFGTAHTTSKIVQILAFHLVAFLVVGLLAARLSERQFSNAKLRVAEKNLINLRVLHERIVESIRSGLITTNLDGVIYTFNLAAEEITGCKAKDVRGKNISEVFGDIEIPVNSAIDSGHLTETPNRHEMDMLSPDGFALHIGYGVSPLFDESRKTTGLIITFQDLTEIRSMEESVRRKDRLAAVGRVAAGLAHEIRNPLGAMRGAIQVMQSSVPPESAQASLMEIILRESDRLNKIITNFLTYARPRISNFSEIDIKEALGEMFTLLKHSPDIKETHSIEFLPTEDPITISADPTQLKQIFWNLSRNSIQAMNDGGKLTVGLNQITPNRVQITFTDTGCGMSPEQVEQLFEPFSNSTTGGTGLGLSIVYQIVRDHGGTINVKSIQNKGTTITLEFPVNIRKQAQSLEKRDPQTDETSKLETFLTIKN